MIFRLLRLFFLRFLPRRMFAVLSFLELALMARRIYRDATKPAAPPPRLVGRSGFDDEAPNELGAPTTVRRDRV